MKTTDIQVHHHFFPKPEFSKYPDSVFSVSYMNCPLCGAPLFATHIEAFHYPVLMMCDFCQKVFHRKVNGKVLDRDNEVYVAYMVYE